MDWYKNPIGEYAGIVWRTLCNRELTWEELLKETGLHPLEAASAVGWLARENKMNIRTSGGVLRFSVYRENYL